MTDDHRYANGIQKLFLLREAIASVSLSHAENCRCIACRAAHGDEEAFALLIAEIGDS